MNSNIYIEDDITIIPFNQNGIIISEKDKIYVKFYNFLTGTIMSEIIIYPNIQLIDLFSFDNNNFKISLDAKYLIKETDNYALKNNSKYYGFYKSCYSSAYWGTKYHKWYFIVNDKQLKSYDNLLENIKLNLEGLLTLDIYVLQNAEYFNLKN